MKKTERKKKQIAYITGGSSGIGLACAGLLARKGTDLVLLARGREALERTVAEIRKTSPAITITTVTMDISSKESVSAALAEAVEKAGLPDLIINSAGVGQGDYFENIHTESFEALMKTNVFGSWHLAKAALPLLEKTSGHLVLLSSVAGIIGMFGYSAYSTSKFAVLGLAEALRSEMRRRGVTVSVVCPPEVTTPFISEERKTLPPEALAVKLMAGALTPERTARVILRGIKRKRFMIIPGFRARAVSFFHRVSGGFISRLFSDIITGRKKYRRA